METGKINERIPEVDIEVDEIFKMLKEEKNFDRELVRKEFETLESLEQFLPDNRPSM